MKTSRNVLLSDIGVDQYICTLVYYATEGDIRKITRNGDSHFQNKLFHEYILCVKWNVQDFLHKEKEGEINVYNLPILKRNSEWTKQKSKAQREKRSGQK